MERGVGAALEVLSQRNVMEVESSSCMESVVQPSAELYGPDHPVDTGMADSGRMEDAPQTHLEETVVAPPVRRKEEVCSGHAEGAVQARTGEGVPLPSTVAVNLPVPSVTERGDTESAPLAVAPLALPQRTAELPSEQTALVGCPCGFEARVREGFPGPLEA